jgi:GAF domain-containing protein
MTTGRRPALTTQQALEQLGSLALAEHSMHSVLQTVADLTTRVMATETEASVSSLVADKAATVVHTGRLALDLDEAQYGRGYGPCLHAAACGERVEVTDTRTETRWADYMAVAAQRGALSSMSIPLGHPVRLGAALNIYSREPAGFDDAARQAADEFARIAGVAVANMHAYRSAFEVADNLRTALRSRTTIDQARGILMERHTLTAEQAFQLLVHTSLGVGRPVRDVASHLVRTGQLLGPTGRSARAGR